MLEEDRSRRGATQVWVTHNLGQARRCATEVLLLLDGARVESAAPEALFTSPRDPRTLRFLSGEMIW
jgi:ABC-type phosphate transport system ATPase subunit